MRTFAFLAAVFLSFSIALGQLTGSTGEAGWRLLVGWLPFLGRTASHATINFSGVCTMAVCAGLLLVVGHRFAVWLSSAWGSPSPAAAASPTGEDMPRQPGWWPLRRTALLLAIVVLMFVAGIWLIGLVHQTAWLATSPEPMTEYRLDLEHTRSFPERNLSSIGLGVQGWADVHKQLPHNGTWPAGEQALHSWQARILPFIRTQNDNIDFKIDWNDPKNVPAFRRFVPHYLNPEFGDLREAHGLAVSHYAGNVRVFEQPERTPTTMPKNRGDRLILCGEVAGDFKAWGDPGNLRDPTLGINRSRAGFGGADESGANFLMADGSTRFIPTSIDPGVLAALSSPDRRE
ncbi:MAG TPA: DUF1559 domain-containing protein [Pirellulales bacterium]|jgi:hypothetical protein|nr:DUF1559 domain-containing protein [Pirellulales bacterium]